MADLLTVLRLEHRAAVARASFLEREIADLEAAAINSNEIPTAFNPAWKHGSRLTALGRRALEAAFRHGMGQAEAARLFRVSMTRTHALHRAWRGEGLEPIQDAAE